MSMRRRSGGPAEFDLSALEEASRQRRRERTTHRNEFLEQFNSRRLSASVPTSVNSSPVRERPEPLPAEMATDQGTSSDAQSQHDPVERPEQPAVVIPSAEQPAALLAAVRERNDRMAASLEEARNVVTPAAPRTSARTSLPPMPTPTAGAPLVQVIPHQTEMVRDMSTDVRTSSNQVDSHATPEGNESNISQ